MSGTSTMTVSRSARQRLRTARLMLELQSDFVLRMVEITSELQTRPKTKLKAASVQMTEAASRVIRTVVTFAREPLMLAIRSDTSIARTDASRARGGHLSRERRVAHICHTPNGGCDVDRSREKANGKMGLDGRERPRERERGNGERRCRLPIAEGNDST